MQDTNLKADVAERYNPFLEYLLVHHRNKLHSVYIVGSALTQDYDPRRSDINSVIVLHEMDLKVLEALAPLGKKYGKKRIAAPLFMTPRYIDQSRDVFPIEFLNIKLLHHTVFGEDIFQEIEIKKSDLRHQCERELKVKLIGLRQGYILSAGDKGILTKGFADSISGYLPLFKALVALLGDETPHNNHEILSALADRWGIRTQAFELVLRIKHQKTKLPIDKLKAVFEDYYEAMEQLVEMIDALEE